MFEEFIQRRRVMKFTRQLRSTALGQALANHTHEYFSRLPRLSAFSKDSKQKIIYNFYQTIHSFQQAEDPLLAMRERLSAYVLGFSQFSVLSLTEADKEEQHASCPFISGQLHHHIQEIVDHMDHEDELHALQVLYKQNSDASELIEFCKTRRDLYLFYVNGINYVRISVNDSDEENDWLRPFVTAMLIWQEDCIRKKVGLPSLLVDSLDSLRYSSFWNMVESGEPNPYCKWEREWPDLLSTLSGSFNKPTP